MVDIMETLGKRVQEFRKIENMTQAQLAEAANVDTMTISRIESGQQYPKAENLSKIAEVLNVNVYRFFLTDEELATFSSIEDKVTTNFENFDDLLEYCKKNIGDNIRKYRKAKSLLQDELAKAAGITQQTLSGIENGNFAPSFKLAVKLAVVLEIPLAYIFTFDEKIYNINDKELIYLATKAFAGLDVNERRIAFKLIDVFKNEHK